MYLKQIREKIDQESWGGAGHDAGGHGGSSGGVQRVMLFPKGRDNKWFTLGCKARAVLCLAMEWFIAWCQLWDPSPEHLQTGHMDWGELWTSICEDVLPSGLPCWDQRRGGSWIPITELIWKKTLSVMWKWFGLRLKFIIITLISSQASALAAAKENTKA